MEPRFLKWIDRQSREDPAVKHVADVTIAVRTLARMQMLLATRFVAELERRGVPYVLMKGAAASLTLILKLICEADSTSTLVFQSFKSERPKGSHRSKDL
jgi:hypothetical protein